MATAPAKASGIALKPGDKAPEFTLQVDKNKSIALSDFKGKKVVLYFYPKDDTPGCTIEAKDFRDRMKDFEKANTVIIGVSKDDVESHGRFREKYCLPFTLGSDTGSTCEDYGTWGEKSMYGKKYMGIERSTFLIDGNSIIRHIWPKVKVEGHAEEVLQAARAL